MDRNEMIKDIERTLIECCHFINDNNGLSYNKCSNCEYWDDTNNECASYERKQAIAIYNAGYRKEQETVRVILQELYLNFTAENLCGVKNRFVDDKSANLIKRFSKVYGIELE